MRQPLDRINPTLQGAARTDECRYVAIRHPQCSMHAKPAGDQVNMLPRQRVAP
jgi:hypothetical protein